MNFEKETEKLLHFIDESPTAFQAVKNLGDMAEKAGFAELKETGWTDRCPLPDVFPWKRMGK